MRCFKNIFKLIKKLVRQQVPNRNWIRSVKMTNALLILPTTQDFIVEPIEPIHQRTKVYIKLRKSFSLFLKKLYQIHQLQ